MTRRGVSFLPFGRRVCLAYAVFAYGKQSVGGTVLKVRIINPKDQTFVLLEDSMGVGTNTFFFFAKRVKGPKNKKNLNAQAFIHKAIYIDFPLRMREH